MKNKDRIINVLSLLLCFGVIVSALTGLIYTSGGDTFLVRNVYGNSVEIYGDGIYAYNSVFVVANQMGSDAAGIITVILLIILTLWKNKPIWAEYIRVSGIVTLAYRFACLVFGVALNQLYFLYVICFGISLACSIMAISRLWQVSDFSKLSHGKGFRGTGIFLVAAGGITAGIWISSILPVIINNTYGELLGIQTTESTYGIDLSMTCPIFILCGIWVIQKKDIGYRIAPILLNMLIGIAILVLLQRAYCIKLGVEIPLTALASMILSFVIMGIFAVIMTIRMLDKIKER